MNIFFQNKSLQLFLLVLLVVSLVSCDIQKRKYQKGFYVEHISKNKENKIYASQADINLQHDSQNQFQASVTNEIELGYKNETRASGNFPVNNCDTIILNNGVKMLVNVISVGDVNVMYKSCEGGNDNIQHIESNKINSISYADGNKITMSKKDGAPSSSDYKPYKSKDDYKNKEAERGSKQLDNAIIALAIGLLFGPSMILGFILAALAKNKLENKPGYEKQYKLARSILLAGLAILILTVVIACFFMLITYGII
jgi:hypothetical protein